MSFSDTALAAPLPTTEAAATTKQSDLVSNIPAPSPRLAQLDIVAASASSPSNDMSPAHPATDSSRHSTPATSAAGSDHAQSTSQQPNELASTIASKLAPQPTTTQPTIPNMPAPQSLPEPTTSPPSSLQQAQEQQQSQEQHQQSQEQQQSQDQPQESRQEAKQLEEHPLASIHPAYFYPTDASASSSHDGIPVFEPTMQQFQDFYAFCQAIDSWGMQSGIVKVVPPKEWRDALPDLRPELNRPPPRPSASDEEQQAEELADLSKVRIRNAIVQHFTPAGSGVWRQTNITRTAKIWNAKQWADACLSDGQKGPEMDRMKWKVEVEGLSNGGWGPKNIGIKDSATSFILEEDGVRTRSGKARPSEPKPSLKRKPADGEEATSTQQTQDDQQSNQDAEAFTSPPPSTTLPSSPERRSQRLVQNSPQATPSASSRDAWPVKKKNWEAEATTPDEWRAFDYQNCWRKEALSSEQLSALNSNQQTASTSKANGSAEFSSSTTTTPQDKDASATPPTLPSPSDWTPEICREIESEYWRSLNFGKPPMYGADLKGTLFDDRTKHWNVGKLDNLLNRLRLKRKLPGVNTPYLYWGMWRATFAWHVEDMDLYSINYIHFGAPKQWYAIRQADRQRFESAMAGAFPSDSRRCPHFMRHKSYLASPSFLASHGIRPLKLVHNAGEFVITYPYGYHSGFNLGYNCAESVNFALESWLDIGRKANYCHCDQSQNSVRIDVDAMLDESKEMEELDRKRELRRAKEDPTVRALEEEELEKRRIKNEKAKERRRLKKGAEEAPAGLALPLPFQGGEDFYVDPKESAFSPCVFCPANVHTDLVSTPADIPSTNPKLKAMAGRHAHRLCASFVPETWVGKQGKADVVCGIEGIDKARFSLKCQICSNTNLQKLYPKIQCTRGKCPRSAHVSCALVEDNGWFVDVVAGETADRLESKKEVPAAKVHQTDGLEDGERLVVLCKTHNPLFREAEEARKAEALRERIYALPCPGMVKIRTSGGMFQALMVEVREDEDEIIIQDEGRPSAVKFQQIILDSPSETPPVKEESITNNGDATATAPPAEKGDADAPPVKRRRKQSEKASAAAKAASEEAVEAAILAEANAAAQAEAIQRPRKSRAKVAAAVSQADAEAQAMLEAAESLSSVAGKKGKKGKKDEKAEAGAAELKPKPKRQPKKKAQAGQPANGDVVAAPAPFDAQQQPQLGSEVAWPGHPMQQAGMQAPQPQLPQPPKRGPRATYAAQPPNAQQQQQYPEQHPHYKYTQHLQQQQQQQQQHQQQHHHHHQQPHPQYGMDYGQMHRNQQDPPSSGEYGQYPNQYAPGHPLPYSSSGREYDPEAAEHHSLASRYAQSSVPAASPSHNHPRPAPYPSQYQQHPAYPPQQPHVDSSKSAASDSVSPVPASMHPSAAQYGYISAPPQGYHNRTPLLPTYAKPLSQQPQHAPQMSQGGFANEMYGYPDYRGPYNYSAPMQSHPGYRGYGGYGGQLGQGQGQGGGGGGGGGQYGYSAGDRAGYHPQQQQHSANGMGSGARKFVDEAGVAGGQPQPQHAYYQHQQHQQHHAQQLQQQNGQPGYAGGH
ncbi:hypothetical protein NDA17_006631 [Ustilago hordei]|nr:hypothetical protein NDA17_006631 [Ustilago hordei]